MTGPGPEESAPRRRRSWLGWLVRICFLGTVLVVLAAGAAAVAGYLIYDHVTRPGVAGQPIRVEIPEGATGDQAGRILADAGLVEHELFFRLATRLDSEGRTIKHGRYDLPKGLSPLELLEWLDQGPNVGFDPSEVPDDRRVSIPEGLNLEQMAARFDDPEAFLEAASCPELINRLGIDVPNLEGFLMPDTFFFADKPTEHEVVERMFNHFQRVYTGIQQEAPTPPGLDMLELVTIASLIERESRVSEERPLVSAVIHNRLERNMTLDMDSTLQFALNKYGQRMLNADKEVDSPYNTYRNRGLPPGPIAAPGAEALRAAFQPADAEYLYFVSNADGRTHTFSRTLAEHNRAVARFRREIAPQRRAQQQAAENDRHE